MAYQTRQRDPLLDDTMHEALVRRGQEVVGLVFLALAAALAALLVSYTPDDPNFWAATDAAPENMLGRTGASIAAVAMMITGYAAFVLPAVALAWAVRFVAHQGAERALSRLLFLPIAVALFAVYAASYPPGAGWTHSFGIGGLFGDTVLGALLSALPMPPQAGLRLLAALAFGAGLGVVLFAAGVTLAELRIAGRFLLAGLVAAGAMVATGMREAGGGAATAASGLAARRTANRTEPGSPRIRRDAPAPLAPEQDAPAAPRAMSGIFTRVPRLASRDDLAPEPELVPRPDPEVGDLDLPDEDRLRAKIADVIRSRVRPTDPIAAAAARRREAGLPTRDAEPVLRAPAPAPDATAPARREPRLTLGRAMPKPPPPAEDPVDAFIETPDPRAGYAPEPPREMPRARLPEAPRRMVQHAQKRSPAPSRKAMADSQPSLPLGPEKDAYEVPPLTLLANPATVVRHHLSDEALEENARMLENVLDDYGVKGEIVSVRPGPVVTMYELEPAPGLKASRVIGLADDIARSMSALSARVSTVPGRSVIGIELPNQNREKVVLREILSHRDFGDGNHRLPLALGKDIGGDPVIANLAKMPHLLIAGTTGSGKSVAINTMILSLIYKLTPEDCRMIMIDPKMLELSVYDGIPHLLSPVVTDPKKAVVALKWVVGEMEERYRKMSKMGVRNIDGYNARVLDALSKGEMFSRTVQTGFDDETGDPVFETEELTPEKLPYIVVIVDEMADLMMVAGKEIEACIQRLAQMARASGIHIIMATQRPSVDVITGTIKANFPTRISFHVTSKVDSRTILGEMGAEQLLGMGDMLYMAGGAKITRVHGPFVSDEEVEEIVRHLKSFGPPDYAASVLDGPDEELESDIDAVLGLNTGGNTTGEDALYDQAVGIVVKDRKCSTSYIQRKLGIGYNKAARLVEQMEEAGLVSPANHVGKREILVPEQA